MQDICCDLGLCQSSRYSPFQLYTNRFREIVAVDFADVQTYPSLLEITKGLAKAWLDGQLGKFSVVLRGLKDPEKDKEIKQVHAIHLVLADSKSSLLEVQTDGLFALDTIYALARERALHISNVYKKRSGGLQPDASKEYQNLVYVLEADHDAHIEKLTCHYRNHSRTVARWHQKKLDRFVQNPPNIDAKLPAISQVIGTMS
ncbi:hypothetical protein DSO57_1017964 [Entomophthora muscae]|uniref:Uncharacterized protein n=1 Tax=Entomophthora muscae TaxID=34485 RepID=A0ACC2SHS4_9FUNG|nr:hypothetical protein DSO57_1017964 [Entomophthora muscae]